MNEFISTPARLDACTINHVYVQSVPQLEQLVRTDIVKKSIVCKPSKAGKVYNMAKYCFISNDGSFSLAWGTLPNGRPFGILKLMVKDPKDHNLVGISPKDVLVRLQTIALILKSEYGIVLQTDRATYLSMEIQRTIPLHKAYEEYLAPIKLIDAMLAKERRFRVYSSYGNTTNEGVSRNTLLKTRSQSFYRTSGLHGRTIAIYDKTAQLNTRHGIDVSSNYLRFEIRLLSDRTIKGKRSGLGTNVVSEVTDEMLNSYFNNLVDKMIVKRYREWMLARDKELISFLRTLSPEDRMRCDKVLGLIIAREDETQLPFILDIDELKQLIYNHKVLPGYSEDSRYRFLKGLKDKAAIIRISFLNRNDSKMIELLAKLANKKPSQIRSDLKTRLRG